MRKTPRLSQAAKGTLMMYVSTEGQADIDPDVHDGIEIFLHSPQFKPIRDQIRTDPSQVRVYLAQLQQLSPELHDRFTAEQGLVEEVLDRILDGSFEVDDHIPPMEQDDEEWEDDDVDREPGSSQFHAANIPLANNLLNLNQGQFLSQPALNQADEDSIAHLIGITGHTRERCIEAYIVCNKNVEQAANLLLDGN